MIDEAARPGFDAVEILHRQMTHESPETINRIKRAALLRGLALPMFSVDQGSVPPWADKRGQAIRRTVYGIDPAAKLGYSALRINSGRYGWRELALAWN